MDAKTSKHVKEAIEKGQDPEGNENHAAVREEKLQMEARIARIEELIARNEEKLGQVPYMTQNQLLLVLVDIARVQIDATREVLNARKSDL